MGALISPPRPPSTSHCLSLASLTGPRLVTTVPRPLSTVNANHARANRCRKWRGQVGRKWAEGARSGVLWTVCKSCGRSLGRASSEDGRLMIGQLGAARSPSAWWVARCFGQSILGSPFWAAHFGQLGRYSNGQMGAPDCVRRAHFDRCKLVATAASWLQLLQVLQLPQPTFHSAPSS